MNSRIFLLLALAFPAFAHADLLVEYVNKSSLPYTLSENNYENSPNNYDNSINNYDNSPNNYDNSPNNYDNSKSNYSNTSKGDNRLILKTGKGSIFAGYYVRADNGVTNFFSPKGERMFYNPEEGSAVFHGKSGNFCGVLATVNGEFVLALVKSGQKTLLLNQ